MNKAFIFDMDGVLVDSERAWNSDEIRLLRAMFGSAIADQIHETIVGTSLRDTYARARELGATMPYEEFLRRYDEAVHAVYARAHIADRLEPLGNKLIALGFKLGIVSSSPRSWIEKVLPYIPFRERLEAIISITDTPELKGKPDPDGFLEAFKTLDADPKRSFVLEDSNVGIAAGKASGAFTIGYRGNLVEGYQQTGADVYADTMDEVAQIVEVKMKISFTGKRECNKRRS